MVCLAGTRAVSTVGARASTNKLSVKGTVHVIDRMSCSIHNGTLKYLFDQGSTKVSRAL